MKRILLSISIILFLMTVMVEKLMAIPAFARKYRMSCKTCHAPFPRLKPYGEEFAGNGFVLKDKDAPRYFDDTGDDKLSLIRDFPIALRMDGFITYNNSKSEISDLSTPYNIKLLSGGSLAKNISYYFYFFFSERGKIVGLEDAFIMFGDLFRTGISLTVGQFQVSDPLFKRELRLTYEDYSIYKAAPGSSHADLTYDRGIMLNYTIPKGPDLVFEVLNGTGIEEANVFKNFDNDKYKNIFGRISQDLGDHFRIGASAYYGKEAPEGRMNKTWIWGGDCSFSFSNVELSIQYLERKDDNPYFFSFHPREIHTRGGFAELVFTPGGGDGLWYSVGLYNWVDSDQTGLDYESAALHLGFLLRRNIRLISEFNYIFTSPQGKYARGIIGLIAGF
jgi:hypothetical protein